MKIGVSGHRARDGADWLWVREAMIDVFLDHNNAIGWSSLAEGADQIFAEVALAFGGGLVSVIPFQTSYENEFAGRHRAKYEATLAKSRKVIGVNGDTREAAFFAAGKKVVKACDLMVLVWDGAPARGPGGTADIAEYAKVKRKPTIWLDPIDRRIERF